MRLHNAGFTEPIWEDRFCKAKRPFGLCMAKGPRVRPQGAF